MIINYKKSFQTLTLFLAFSLVNLPIFAFIPEEIVLSDRSAAKVLYTGVLSASDALSVRVNGNIASDGMTILSGAQIKTLNKGGAVIKIHQLGKVEMSEETFIKLEFSEQNVDLQVISGIAILTAYKGVKGKFTGVNGEVLMTDSALEISSIGNSAAVLMPGTAIGGPTLFGLSVWGTVGIIAGAAATWLTVANSTNDSQKSISSVKP